MARRRNPRLMKHGLTWKEWLIVVLVVGSLGAFGWRAYHGLRTEKPKPPVNSVDVTWSFDGVLWRPSANAPACEEPLLEASPIDTSRAVSLLYPGQYRGRDYKPHGGFRFDASKSGDITVRLPMDTRLTGLSRYIEAGEVQYMLTFTNPCGIMLRFDHVRGLSSRLQAIADTLPPPKVNDSRSQPIYDGPKFAMGEVVATAVGLPRNGNISMDFGMYDLRKPNEISKNAQWASLHADKAEQANFAICWFDLLPVTDRDTVRALMARDDPKRTVSDYCATPGGQTLQYNGGRPVSG